MGTPQQNLDTAYPGAVNGDAVLDEVTRDYWYKDNGIWRNIGPRLGETIGIEADISPSTETLLVNLTSKVRLDAKSLPYSLVEVLTICNLSVKSVLDLRGLLLVYVPACVYSLQSYAPSKGTGGVYVFPVTTALAVIPYLPSVDSSLSIFDPVTITVAAFSPGTQATILLESFAGIVVVAPPPTIRNTPSPSSVLISIQAFDPVNIGGSVDPANVAISISAFAPSVVVTIPTAIITIIKSLPDIQTAIVVPSSVAFQIYAPLPDDGGGIIVTNSIVSIVAQQPSVDAYPVIDPTALYGRYTIFWDQPNDTRGGDSGIYSNSTYSADLDSITGRMTVTQEVNPGNGTNYDGTRSTAVLRPGGGSESARFYLDLPYHNLLLLIKDPELNPSERPWLPSYLNGNSNVDAERLFTPAYELVWRDPDTLQMAATAAQQDFIYELWVYPLSESFTGTAETAARPLLCDSWYNTRTNPFVYYRGWDLHYRGIGATGTVYFRANNENYLSSPVGVVLNAQSANNFAANQWNHVLLMRKNNQVGIAVNGVWGTIVNYSGRIISIPEDDQITSSPAIYSGYQYHRIRIGSFTKTDVINTGIPGELNRFSGYLDSIRFQKGYIPFYQFTNFTPPTGRFPYGVVMRNESGISYRTTTSFYEQDMWQWWWYNTVPVYNQTPNQPAMEEGIKLAVNRFIVGCKKDEIWKCFTDCYLFIGVRDLDRLLNYPLHGANLNEWHIDNNQSTNFVESDYNRTTGLKGDGVSKWIRTPRVNNVFSQNNHHRAAWVSTVGTGPIFAGGVNQAGSTYVDWIPGYGGVRHGFTTNVRTISGNDALTSSGGFVGFSRSSASNYQYDVPGASGTVYEASQAPWMEPVEILGASIDQANNYSTVSKGSHRLAFYSHGASVDLSKLKRRVTLLISEIQAAIV